jgi:hypothetical protein
LSSKRNSQLKVTENKYLRKMAGKTKIDRIKSRTKRMVLGIFSHKEIRELAQPRWFGHVVRLGDWSYPKMA